MLRPLNQNKQKTNKILMKYIGYIVSFIFLMVCSTFVSGLVGSKLWNWFIADSFNLPKFGILYAAAVMLTVRFSTFIPKYNKEDEKNDMKKIVEAFIYQVTYSFLILGIGWVLHLFLS